MSSMFGTGIVVNIPSAIILGNKEKPADAIRINTQEGKTTVSFQIGKQMYDSKYDDNVHYNNFLVYAYGDVAERIQRMKLKIGSCVHIWAKMDLTPDIMKNQEQSIDENSPNFAHARWNKGIRLELIAIDYAGGSKRISDNSENESTAEPTVPPIPPSTASYASDDNSRTSSKSTAVPAKEAVPASTSKDATSRAMPDSDTPAGAKQFTDENVEVVDLDSSVDIFRKPRRFFS